MCFMLSQKKKTATGMCVFFIISFPLMWAYFLCKFVGFLFERVCVFALNTVKILCGKT